MRCDTNIGDMERAAAVLEPRLQFAPTVDETQLRLTHAQDTAKLRAKQAAGLS